MGFLILGEEFDKRIKEIVEYSQIEANWYRPGQTPIPGDVSDHVLVSGMYLAVFSYTVFRGSVYRMLSVSCAIPGRLPSTGIVTQLAIEFGFTPNQETWIKGISHGEGVLLVAEKVQDVEGGETHGNEKK